MGNTGQKAAARSDFSRRAEAGVKAVLEPLLRKLGFEGHYPIYRRLATDQVHLAWAQVSVRVGVRIDLGSLPLRATLAARRPERDILAMSSGQLTLGVMRMTVPGYVPIDSAAAQRALPAKVAALGRELGKVSAPFWAGRAKDMARRRAIAQLTAAVRSGDLRALRAALATLPRRQAEQGLDAVRVDPYGHEVRKRVWRLAPALLEYRPVFWMIAAILAVEAVTRQHQRAPARER